MPKPWKPAGAMLAMLIVCSGGAAMAQQACPVVGTTLIEAEASAGTRPVRGPRGQVLQVRREMITTTADIAGAAFTGDGVDGQLLLKFHPEADARLTAATTGHPGLRFAFVVDDEALLAVTWEGEYGLYPGGVQISMSDGYDRARDLTETLRRCISAR